MLAGLERELEDESFLVVGVHSPKFPNERDETMVREAVRRYAVTHPVVIDPGRRIWDEWGVNAWPTLVVVDENGEIVAAGSGEPDPEALHALVRDLLPEARAATLPLRPQPAPPGSLAYPGKVIASGDRLFVADTGHDQIVEADLDGNELRRLDGFRHPNGLALAGDALYVADTGAHAIRRVHLASGATEAVAEGLRSPWDVAWDGELLYVAMAGSHQIWFHDAAAAETDVFAGTGHELRRDGPVAGAAFAQPSGLAVLDGSLYIADSEISSIRAIDDLAGLPTARTVCGSGELFGFGDRDGFGADVLLQHPIGIAAGEGVLFVADSFNHKVKRVDPASGECRTLVGGLERLPETAEPGFWEPEGLAYAEGILYVADTNNHRVVAVGLESGERRTLLGA